MPPGFEQIEIRERYRSDSAEIAKDFYEPVLGQAVTYSRAVGYFTSGALELVMRGLERFLARAQAPIRFVASPILAQDDVEAIRAALEGDSDDLERVLRERLELDHDGPIPERLKLLAWLIATERLQIKLAYAHDDGQVGLYHEKFGVFADERGERIAFMGSANETVGGLRSNFESIAVFRSWNAAEQHRVTEYEADFEGLWAGTTRGVEVVDLPEAIREELVQRAAFRDDAGHLEHLERVLNRFRAERGGDKLVTPPRYQELRPHQVKAIDAWWSNRGRGVFALATGAGKTVSAIECARRFSDKVAERGAPSGILVVVPYRHLAEQWAREFQLYGVDAIQCHGSRSQWMHRVQQASDEIVLGKRRMVVVIATANTYRTSHFQKARRSMRAKWMIIGDEVHNLGAANNRRELPQDVTTRLGLSATPDRWFDDEGTDALYAYFGDVVSEYSIADALADGVLVPYDYFAIPVGLTEDESEQYYELTERIGKALAVADGDMNDEGVTALLVRRSRLLASAHGKLQAVVDLAPELREGHALVYCGDGRVDEDGDGEADRRQIEAVTVALGRTGLKVARYTATEGVNERRALERTFGSGDIDVLTSIRCLDEGVDIPATRTAVILASSSNPRQFVQRRGRVLRRAAGKEFARIWDVVAVPQERAGYIPQFDIDKRLMQKELSRIIEFARTSRNGVLGLDARLRVVMTRYGMDEQLTEATKEASTA